MAISFPSNPSNGDKFESNSVLYQYDGTNSLWIRLNRKDVSHYTDASDLLPAQTLQVVNVPDLASLPSNADTGQMVYVTGENKLYLWTGSTWQTMTLAKQNPVLTSTTDGSGGTSPFTLATDGSTTVITMTASHPDSLPLIYNYNVVAGSLTNGGGTTATITQGTGAQVNQFFIQPATDAAYNGSFTVEFTVSDGEATEVSVGEFTLAILTGSWYGDRAVVAGGSAMSQHNEIDYFDLTTPGNAIGFGNLTVARSQIAGASDGTYAVYSGHDDYLDYITIASIGNATTFGTLSRQYRLHGSIGDGTYGYAMGGFRSTWNLDIDRWTMATPGNSSDVGNLTNYNAGFGVWGNGDRTLLTGGTYGSTGREIEYISLQNLSSGATAFGNLTVQRNYCYSTGDSTRVVMAGGRNVSDNDYSNVVDYVTIDTPGNATSFGNLSQTVIEHSATSNLTYGAWTGGSHSGGPSGGGTYNSQIDYLTIQTTGTSTDHGDLTIARNSPGITSGSPS